MMMMLHDADDADDDDDESSILVGYDIILHTPGNRLHFAKVSKNQMKIPSNFSRNFGKITKKN